MNLPSNRQHTAAFTADGEPAFYTYIRRDSSQLFFLFTGYGHELNINPLDFVRQTRIADRNIVIFRDPYYASYQSGISEQYSSLDGIVRLQRELLERTFPHVGECFCAGTSSGGPAAIYTGHQLGVRAVWSLAGRAAKSGFILDRERAVHDLHMHVLGRPKGGNLTPQERQKIIDTANDPEVLRIQARLRDDPDSVLDEEQTAALVALIGPRLGVTRFHFYYATTNAIDCGFAEPFQACPAASLHPITPPHRDRSLRPYSTDRDHAIVMILAQRGDLDSLFSDYLSRE